MAQPSSAPGVGAGTSGPDSESELVNLSLFDLLCIELVPMAERLAREYEASLDTPSLTNKSIARTVSSNPGASTAAAATTTTIGTGATGGGGSSTSGAPTSVISTTYDGLPETEVFKDSVYFRLERLGFRVGQGLSEKFSKERPRFADHLDVIKFLCKDVWTIVFKKQIDNLKTNHRGVFVLTDTRLRLITRMSMRNGQEAVARAQPHLIFPCGIIRGVLSSLGIKATVKAETSELPAAIFQITITASK